jgi:hypothetical protein
MTIADDLEVQKLMGGSSTTSYAAPRRCGEPAVSLPGPCLMRGLAANARGVRAQLGRGILDSLG